MSLLKYKSKRKFGETPEPQGKAAKASKALIFVIQRHHASHLHYDFRLELKGVLKSWAVPKGPSLNPKDKRLAMQVEDHPLDYATFEGNIPAGNYGAGHVDVWDHGSYEPLDEEGEVISVAAFAKNLAAGSIKFRLKGKLLKGDFALVNMKKDEKTWLLIKHRDKYATDEEYSSEDYAKKSGLKYSAERAKQQVVKKKVMPVSSSRMAETKPAIKAGNRGYTQMGRKVSNYIKPMLAKLAEEPFDDVAWLFEIKWDGYRTIAETGKTPRLYSRNGLSFAEQYPLVFDELKKIKKRAVLDGEIVAFDKKGKPRFQLLQQYKQEQDASICYYVFDCLYVNGKSIEGKPLTERKEILKGLLPASDIVVYCDHIEAQGKKFFAAVGKKGMEGIMAKRADSIYKEGVRTGDWLKLKHATTEDAVIAGYTAPRGGRNYFGALVLGVYHKGGLVYIGHTGTGFTDISLKELHRLLEPLKTDRSPFDTDVRVNMPVTWVKPKLVCMLKYSEITTEGHRRHPVFMGLRVDLDAEQVIG